MTSRCRCLIYLFVLGAGCEPGGPTEPKGATIELVLVPDDDLGSTASLRHAVVWTTKSGAEHELLVTGDGPLVDTIATISLGVPPPEVLRNVDPVQRLLVGYAADESLYTEAHCPRFVVYEDVDGDGAFSPDALDRSGPDRVLGIDDQPTIAAILDLESALEKVPLHRAEAFYLATDGSYSAFVSVAEAGQLTLKPWDPRVFVSVSNPDFARASLDCLRPDVGVDFISTAMVDEAVPLSVCGLSIPVCTSVNLTTMDPPDLPDPARLDPAFRAQCRRRGELEALVIVKSSIECEECTCTQLARETTHVAHRSRLPEWWPCGGVLEVCADNDPFSSYSYACEAELRASQAATQGAGDD